MMNNRQKAIADLCDGSRTSTEIAALCGDSAKYVQRCMVQFDLPRLRRGAKLGAGNHQYKTGRRIDRDGYVLVTAPADHPHRRNRTGRKSGLILEHRLVLEGAIGRYLDPQEVVDHVDGLHLHNAPSNLRLFRTNADHLRDTISGQVPKWSPEGRQRQHLPHAQRQGLKPVDSYRQRKKSGDVRLLQILLAAKKLGIGSPYLLGTRHHLEKAGLYPLERSSLERALVDLYPEYA